MTCKIDYKIHTSSLLNSFDNSRLALKSLLEEKGEAVEDIKRDLELINFHHLRYFPDYLTSISHTKGAGAALLAPKEAYLGLGVDIEWVDRPIKSESQKYFTHPEDRHSYPLLETWCLKEAAFKALSPLGYDEVLVLSKIILKEDSFWAQGKEHIKGKISFKIVESSRRQLIIAIACIEK